MNAHVMFAAFAGLAQKPWSPKSYHKPDVVSSLSAAINRRSQTLHYARLIQHPPPNDLIAAFGGQIAPPALMSVFLASLNVERLAQQFARFDVGDVDALLQGQIVLQHLRR